MPLRTVQLAPNGFTLTEMLVTISIVSILAAIMLPSFFSFLARQKVENGLAQVRAALQNTQREAMRKGIGCTVNIPNGGTTITGTCLQGADSTVGGAPAMVASQGVQFSWNGGTIPTGGAITFTYKGVLTQAIDSTILIRATDSSTNAQKCVAFSIVGVIRSGDWNGSNCITTDM